MTFQVFHDPYEPCTNKRLCLRSFNSSLKCIILPARVREHSFILDYYILGDFNELIQRKQEWTGFRFVTSMNLQPTRRYLHAMLTVTST